MRAKNWLVLLGAMSLGFVVPACASTDSGDGSGDETQGGVDGDTECKVDSDYGCAGTTQDEVRETIAGPAVKTTNAEAWKAADGGDVVMVSHQAPIWITHLRVAGLPLRHDPRTRRCALSSVTSFELVGDVWREVAYTEPAATGGAVDVGAV